MKLLGKGMYWQDMKVGERFRTFGRTITEPDIVAFVGVTGMLELLFTNEVYRQTESRIKGRLAPGALVFSFAEGLVIAGTLGSWAGAALMYAAARFLGRPLLERFGPWVFITPQKIAAAETWSRQFGTMGVFVARLLPVIRHLIGIPAGVVHMNYWKFSGATVLGSALWCSVLCWVGVTAGRDEQLMQGSLHRISLWVGGLMLFLGVLYYVFVHRHMRR